MNVSEDEVRAELERLRQHRQRPVARAYAVVEITLERIGLLLGGCLIVYVGWIAARSLHQPIGDKPISSLTLHEVGSNLLAGLVLIISWSIAAKVAFSRNTDRDRALRAEAMKNVVQQRRREVAYGKSKLWGVLTDPNLTRSRYRGPAFAILLVILAVLILIVALAARLH
jgi:hypothetical protein